MTDGQDTPRRRRILKISAIVVLALVVAGVIGWMVVDFAGHRAVDREVALILAAGEPVTFDELAARIPEVAAEDDAGPLYSEAIRKAAVPRDELDDLLDAIREVAGEGQSPPDDLVERVQAFIEANGQTLALIDRGAQLGGCNYAPQVGISLTGILEDGSSLRAIARLVSLRTETLAGTGRGDEACDSMVAGLRMLRTMDRKPMLITHLVKLAIFQLLLGDASRIIERGDASDESLAALGAAVEQVEAGMDLERVYMGERVFSLMMAQFGQSEQMPGGTTPFSGPFLEGMYANVIRNNGRIVAACRGDWPGVLDTVSALDQEIEEDWSLLARLSAMTVPGAAPAFALHGRAMAVARSVRGAIAVEKFRRAQGRLPADAADLEAATGAKLPADPFTGKPLIYLRTTDGYTVYSAGDNRTDEGGNLRARAPRQGDFGVEIRTDLQPAGR